MCRSANASPKALAAAGAGHLNRERACWMAQPNLSQVRSGPGPTKLMVSITSGKRDSKRKPKPFGLYQKLLCSAASVPSNVLGLVAPATGTDVPPCHMSKCRHVGRFAIPAIHKSNFAAARVDRNVLFRSPGISRTIEIRKLIAPDEAACCSAASSRFFRSCRATARRSGSRCRWY
jgi:hypothetical protein